MYSVKNNGNKDWGKVTFIDVVHAVKHKRWYIVVV